jgi:hypothetical protein
MYQQGSIDMKGLQELMDKTEERMTPSKKRRSPQKQMFKSAEKNNNEQVTHLDLNLSDNNQKKSDNVVINSEREKMNELDENAKKDYIELDEMLDELLYEAYSHFLHSREPFYFNMPKQMKEFVAEKLEELLGKLNIQKDTNSEMYFIPDQKISIGMLQSEFADFKKYCLDCYVQKKSARK